MLGGVRGGPDAPAHAAATIGFTDRPEDLQLEHLWGSWLGFLGSVVCRGVYFLRGYLCRGAVSSSVQRRGLGKPRMLWVSLGAPP